jgi:hypothetical protein
MNDLSYLVGAIVLLVLYYFLFYKQRTNTVTQDKEMQVELLEVSTPENQPESNRFEEVLNFLNEPSEGNPNWECAKQLNSTFIYRKKTENASINVIKASTIIENTTVDVVSFLIWDVKERSKWDTLAKNLTTLESISLNHDLIRFEVDSPMPALVAPREFLQYRLWKKEGDSIAMVMWSEEKPEIPVPAGFTRAETVYAGYLITTEGSNVRLVLIINNDMKGNIPPKLINTMAPQKSMEWIKKLAAACKQKAG